MTDETKDLQRAIDNESAALSDNLAILGDMARDLTDWRVQVRRHPLPAIGLALGAGALLALLAGRGRGRATRGMTRGNQAAPANRVAGAYTESPAHQAVDRVINALVGVAMTRAIELVGDLIPDFGHHLQAEAELAAPPAEPLHAGNGRA